MNEFRKNTQKSNSHVLAFLGMLSSKLVEIIQFDLKLLSSVLFVWKISGQAKEDFGYFIQTDYLKCQHFLHVCIKI